MLACMRARVRARICVCACVCGQPAWCFMTAHPIKFNSDIYIYIIGYVDGSESYCGIVFSACESGNKTLRKEVQLHTLTDSARNALANSLSHFSLSSLDASPAISWSSRRNNYFYFASLQRL